MKHDGMNLQEETLIYTVWCSIVNLMMWWVDGQSTHFTKLQSMFMKAQDTDTDQGQLAKTTPMKSRSW